MERHIRHRVCAELFQPTASLIARQSDICMIWRLLNARLRQNLISSITADPNDHRELR